MATYTIDFCKYPTPPGPGCGIKQLLGHIARGDVVVLKGNPAGFEQDIQSLRHAGVDISDQTEAGVQR